MTLTIHHLALSQSERIVWLAEELQLDYELIRYARDKTTGGAPPDYQALHPMGLSPVITDGPDGEEITLAETSAIFDYLFARHGTRGLAVSPEDPAAHATYLYWLHFTQGTLLPSELIHTAATRLAHPDRSDPFVTRVAARSARAYALVEQRLGAVPFLAGDRFTAADMMVAFPLTTLRRAIPRQLGPHTTTWLHRLADTTKLRQAKAKCDPGEPLILD
jgi:glutathione S-transferase